MPWARSFCPFRACGAKLKKVQFKRGTRPLQQKVKSGEEWVKSG